MNTNLKFIGKISSAFKHRSECPRQPSSNLEPAQLIIYEDFLPAADGLHIGDEIYIFTWLHKSDRNILKCHPRGNKNIPKKGVFATRSPDRPNPIGLHRVRILNIHDNVFTIHPIEVMDNTPVIDIKIVSYGRYKIHFGPYIDGKIAMDIKKTGYRAWLRGLISGVNGNISALDNDGHMVITNSGVNKGMIEPGDLAAYDMVGDRVLYGNPSSEYRMHINIYKNQSKARAILHTHPLNIIMASEKFNNFLEKIEVFEKEIFLEKIGFVEPLKPGSLELAQAVGKLSVKKQLIVLKKHGLIVYGKTLKECLSLSEELEKLAEMANKLP